MKNNMLARDDYKRIFKIVPRVTIEIMYVNENGQVLLTLRTIEPYKNMWHIPGGGLLFEETISDAIDRISKQELGIIFNDKKFLTIREYFPSKEYKDFTHAISNIYQVGDPQGDIIAGNGSKEVRLFNIDTLPKNTIEIHKSLIKDFANLSQ